MTNVINQRIQSEQRTVMAQKLELLKSMEYIQTYPIANPKTGMISLLADTRFDGAILVNQEENVSWKEPP